MSVGSVGNGTRYESGVSWEWDQVCRWGQLGMGLGMKVGSVGNGTKYESGVSWEWD